MLCQSTSLDPYRRHQPYISPALEECNGSCISLHPGKLIILYESFFPFPCSITFITVQVSEGELRSAEFGNSWNYINNNAVQALPIQRSTHNFKGYLSLPSCRAGAGYRDGARDIRYQVHNPRGGDSSTCRTHPPHSDRPPFSSNPSSGLDHACFIRSVT